MYVFLAENNKIYESFTFKNLKTLLRLVAGKDGDVLSDQFEDLAKLLQKALDAGKQPEAAALLALANRSNEEKKSL